MAIAIRLYVKYADWALDQWRSGQGKSIMMRRAADKDRKLQSFPRAAFKHLPEEDSPILGVLAGPSGPGWFPHPWRSEQWSGMLFPLETELPAYDFVHPVSARTPAAVRRLMLAQVDYLRFSVRIAGGEYVPYELQETHESRHDLFRASG